MWCYAYILNLIVKNVLEIIKSVLENIRESVFY
jgi:hypothetical protein